MAKGLGFRVFNLGRRASLILEVAPCLANFVLLPTGVLFAGPAFNEMDASEPYDFRAV